MLCPFRLSKSFDIFIGAISLYSSNMLRVRQNFFKKDNSFPDSLIISVISEMQSSENLMLLYLSFTCFFKYTSSIVMPLMSIILLISNNFKIFKIFFFEKIDKSSKFFHYLLINCLIKVLFCVEIFAYLNCISLKFVINNRLIIIKMFWFNMFQFVFCCFLLNSMA